MSTETTTRLWLQLQLQISHDKVHINTLLGPKTDGNKRHAAKKTVGEMEALPLQDLIAACPSVVICQKCHHVSDVAAHQLCKSPTVKLPRNLCENFIRQRSMRHEDAAGWCWSVAAARTLTTKDGWYEIWALRRNGAGAGLLQPASVWHTVNEEKWPKVFYKCFALRSFCFAVWSVRFAVDLATPERRKYICHKRGFPLAT